MKFMACWTQFTCIPDLIEGGSFALWNVNNHKIDMLFKLRRDRTRSCAANIADVALISLWHFAQRKETHGLNKRLCILTCFEVVCKVQAIYLKKLYCAHRRPGIIMANGTGGEEEIAGINNPPLAAAASDSVAVTVLKLLRESHQHLQTCLEQRSAVGVASNPSFPSQILSHTAWRFSPKLQDKILDGILGFEAILEVVACLHSHLRPNWTQLGNNTGKGWTATHNHLVHRLKTGDTAVAKTWGQNQQLPTPCCSCQQR